MTWQQRPAGRSVQCNGEALRRHRARRGWTQPELASLAGFTTRLVAKAEACGTVSPDTLEVLADALSTAQHPVFPEDLAYCPKAVVRHIIESFAQYERQCVAHCQQFLADNLRVVAPGDPELFPFAGIHDTIDGFDEFWGKYFAVMERHDKLHIAKTMRLVAEDNLVVALVEEHASHKSTQEAAWRCPKTPLTFVFTFQRGKVVSFEDHFDAVAAAATVAAIRSHHDSANGPEA